MSLAASKRAAIVAFPVWWTKRVIQVASSARAFGSDFFFSRPCPSLSTIIEYLRHIFPLPSSFHRCFYNTLRLLVVFSPLIIFLLFLIPRFVCLFFPLLSAFFAVTSAERSREPLVDLEDGAIGDGVGEPQDDPLQNNHGLPQPPSVPQVEKEPSGVEAKGDESDQKEPQYRLRHEHSRRSPAGILFTTVQRFLRIQRRSFQPFLRRILRMCTKGGPKTNKQNK